MTGNGRGGHQSRVDWEQHARWWQDGFTDGVDAEYEEQILPLAEQHLAGARRVLDVGCGEGQVARRVAHASGTAVIGFDPSQTQVAVARKRAGGPVYARADADRLPVADASVDAVVACLVFEHIDAVDGALGEVARVLEPGGRFVFFLNHPLLQTPGSGWIDDQIIDPPEQYWRVGPYLDEAETVEEVASGVHIRFVHRPLSRYVNAMSAVGLTLTEMVEPAPPPGFLARAREYELAASIPRLLLLRAERRQE